MRINRARIHLRQNLIPVMPRSAVFMVVLKPLLIVATVLFFHLMESCCIGGRRTQSAVVSVMSTRTMDSGRCQEGRYAFWGETSLRLSPNTVPKGREFAYNRILILLQATVNHLTLGAGHGPLVNGRLSRH